MVLGMVKMGSKAPGMIACADVIDFLMACFCFLPVSCGMYIPSYDKVISTLLFS